LREKSPTGENYIIENPKEGEPIKEGMTGTPRNVESVIAGLWKEGIPTGE
jgi:hypothetical protein